MHDTHLTETAKLADVVLPAVTNYEKRGTTVNLEGRFLPLQQAALSAGEGADLIRTLAALAEALGVRPKVRGLRSAQAALESRLGVRVSELPAGGELHPGLNRFTAPMGRAHTPQLWKPRMHPQFKVGAWVERIENLVENKWELPMYGGDD